MEIVGIIIFGIVFLIYIGNKRGKAKWKKIITEFLLHYPLADMTNLIKELMMVTSQTKDIRLDLAFSYIHLTSSVLSDSRKTGVNNRHNILTIMLNDLYLCQLLYANYQCVVANMNIKGIGSISLEYFDFMEKVCDMKAMLEK